MNISNLKQLKAQLDGELRFDYLSKLLYATDASAYREIPKAVAFPKNKADIFRLIEFARNNKTSIIARGAGTSLAGQVVGNGIVVDISKYLNKIIEINPSEKWARVEPGVVLAELNSAVKQYGLQFGPETSTANRCTMGGMLGNNSCGLHSLVHGSVREHLLEVTAFLSDGSEVVFGGLDNHAFSLKTKGDSLENKLYGFIQALLSQPENQIEIEAQYPDPSVPRRNNGYALDLLAQMQPFKPDGKPFNFSKLIAGSEGTLAFVTEIKLNLVPLPPKEKALLCVHFHSLEESFQANLLALNYAPSAIELMDKNIIDLAKTNIGASRNRFFIEGDPGAILIIELWSDLREQLVQKASDIESDLRKNGLGYAFPLIWDNDIPKVWALRTAGLGVLSNMPGDAKPVSVVEDTAIPVSSLRNYLSDFQLMLDKVGLKAVYHAHIATGELHLRPMLNLKDRDGLRLFRHVAYNTALLVKKYRGSLSGEHGDGRLRGEFIPIMMGDKVFGMLKELKNTFDPDNIFNPGKIIDSPPMDSFLRYKAGDENQHLNPFFSYHHEGGITRAIERCNGSADCLKMASLGGTMCPSYMATRNEMHSTRGRANILRELITKKSKIFWADQYEINYSLDLCLSCKACKSECPSGIDMAKLKADFLFNHYAANPIPFSVKVAANYPVLMKWATRMAPAYHFISGCKPLSLFVKYIIGFSKNRPLPQLSPERFDRWSKQRAVATHNRIKRVYLFNDEFLNSTDSHVGIKAVMLLERLGYEVIIPQYTVSGRTYISKGFLKKASKLAQLNIELFKNLVSDDTPLVGIEPSGVLSIRDEYKDFALPYQKKSIDLIAANSFMIDEFIVNELKKGNISPRQFTTASAEIKLHGHCHQKSLATTEASRRMLSIPENYLVTEIPSGCCGMAGSFGYEKGHYELSMQIGELILFPEIRKSDNEVIIAAPGTSCREQIYHGTGKKAYHPVEILFDALL
jgi:FAD/FMN-containing dehydrogenase/Fe-S oxidoreductase